MPVGLLHQRDSKDPYSDLESIVLTEDFNLGDTSTSQETDTGSTGQADETEVPFAEQETLHTPPEMPDVAEITPLPEVPDMPASIAKSAEPIAPAPTQPRPVPVTPRKSPTRSTMPTSTTGGSPLSKTAAAGKPGNGGRNGGSGLSDANRLAGGRMPAPAYPSEARAKGQTGTVIVEFVVGEKGSVVSAHVKSASPWPLLNERAVSAVRRWKFLPGSVAKYSRPIVFKLQ